jgi:hypothetical protein
MRILKFRNGVNIGHIMQNRKGTVLEHPQAFKRFRKPEEDNYKRSCPYQY